MNDEAFARAKPRTSRFFWTSAQCGATGATSSIARVTKILRFPNLLTSILWRLKWIVTSARCRFALPVRHQRHFRPGWLAIDGIFAADANHFSADVFSRRRQMGRRDFARTAAVADSFKNKRPGVSFARRIAVRRGRASRNIHRRSRAFDVESSTRRSVH